MACFACVLFLSVLPVFLLPNLSTCASTSTLKPIVIQNSSEKASGPGSIRSFNAGNKQKPVVNKIDSEKDLEKQIPAKKLNRDVNSVAEFWIKRTSLADSDLYKLLGHRMPLTKRELEANQIVLAKKFVEFDKALSTIETFPPSISFFQAKALIEESDIFQIIRKVPKGGTLSSLLIAAVPLSFMYNLTYAENLFFLFENTLQFKFSRTAPAPGWRLLSELRDSDNAQFLADVNDELNDRLSLIPNPDSPNSPPTFLELLYTYSNLTSYKPNLEKTFNQALKVLYEDNVMYADFYYNFPEVYDLNGRIYTPLEVLNYFKTLLATFISTHKDFVGVRFLYSPLEALTENNIGEFRRTATNLWRSNPELVAGFGILLEADIPYSHWVEEFLKFPEDLKLFLDAGVTNNWGIDRDYNLLDAVSLNAAAIGGGAALKNHPLVVEKLREKNIPVKVGPITSQLFGIASDLRTHPLTVLVATDFPITIVNVAGTAWNATGLSYDWYETYLAMTPRFCDLRCLKQFAVNSLLHSNLSNEEKKRSIRLWQTKWDKFIDFVNENYTL